jgi:hypothetical protein
VFPGAILAGLQIRPAQFRLGTRSVVGTLGEVPPTTALNQTGRRRRLGGVQHHIGQTAIVIPPRDQPFAPHLRGLSQRPHWEHAEIGDELPTLSAPDRAPLPDDLSTSRQRAHFVRHTSATHLQTSRRLPELVPSTPTRNTHGGSAYWVWWFGHTVPRFGKPRWAAMDVNVGQRARLATAAANPMALEDWNLSGANCLRKAGEQY